jgi:hypothetical protein
VAAHTEDTLGSARIAQILNLPFAVATAEAARAEGLVAGENGQVFDLVAAGIAAICTVVADEGAVAEEEQVGVRVKQGAAGVTSEAVDVPSVAGCERGRESDGWRSMGGLLGHTELKSLAFFQDLHKTVSARNGLVILHVWSGAPRRSPCKGRRHPRRPWATRGQATPWLPGMCGGGGVEKWCWWCGIAQQWGLPARLTRASRGASSRKVDERSGVRVVRCRVRVVDSRMADATSWVSGQSA